MARRRGLDKDDVIAAALTIVDRDGLDALSLKAVADALDVQSPYLQLKAREDSRGRDPEEQSTAARVAKDRPDGTFGRGC